MATVSQADEAKTRSSRKPKPLGKITLFLDEEAFLRLKWCSVKQKRSPSSIATEALKAHLPAVGAPIAEGKVA